MLNKGIILAVLVISSISIVQADDSDSEANVRFSCKLDDKYKLAPTSHPDLQTQALKLGPELCRHALLISDDDIAAIKNKLLPFVNDAHRAMIETFPDNKFEYSNEVADVWRQNILKFDQNLDYMSPVKYVDVRKGGGPNKFSYEVPGSTGSYRITALNDDMQDHCDSLPNSATCQDAYNRLNAAITPAFAPFLDEILKDNGKKLSILQNQWQSFVDESRYQWPWEVYVTTEWHSDHFNGPNLVGPPPTQIFFLHPSAVIEHSNNAPKGDKDRVSVALEWFGMNWWEKGIGFSITSVYNDDKTIDSVGTGFSIHIKNKYSIGWVKRSDGNDSVFVNVNLMDVFTDAEEKYKKYRSYF